MKEIFHRTSIRQFQDKEVEVEKIQLLLRAGMQAPSAGNQQPWEFYVVRNKELLAKLAETSPYAGCVKNAPLAIVIASRDDVIFPDYQDIDCAIATESMMLEADALELGSVMLGIAPLQERVKAVSELLHMPEHQHAFTILAAGYPIEVKPQQDRYDEKKVHFAD
ncbi:MAG: nitroreductase family protein [Lachnospiraceae bacterium]|nr:nitroreductase family protein [Lachnospiraceae bacterium]